MTNTTQEIFDTVAKHLLAQGERSMDADGDCVYRGEGGLKCAIGCLIPDSNYTPNIEGLNIHETSVQRLLPFPLNKAKKRLLDNLQCLHDMRPEKAWVRYLRDIAADHGLNSKAITEQVAA